MDYTTIIVSGKVYSTIKTAENINIVIVTNKIEYFTYKTLKQFIEIQDHRSPLDW